MMYDFLPDGTVDIYEGHTKPLNLINGMIQYDNDPSFEKEEDSWWIYLNDRFDTFKRHGLEIPNEIKAKLLLLKD